MANLTTQYMGIELKNPIVVASSGLVSTVDGVTKAADAGAGAIVLKSLFEEQIRHDASETAAGLEDWSHPEAQAYMQAEVWMRYGPRDYCRLIEQCKKKVSVPIIASVNCVTDRWWTDYASDLAGAGADAIELNVLIPGTDVARAGSDVERAVVDVIHRVASQVTLPVAAKIGSSYASLAHMVAQLHQAGAKGVVLFNRYHQPDIDIESLSLKHASPFSEPSEMHLALRWIGLLAGTVNVDFAASTGVHGSEHAAKQLLAGATVVQLCSALYRNGLGHIGSVVQGLDQWMDGKGFGSVDEFRGRLSHGAAESPGVYERRQYIKHLVGIH